MGAEDSASSIERVIELVCTRQKPSSHTRFLTHSAGSALIPMSANCVAKGGCLKVLVQDAPITLTHTPHAQLGSQ